MRLRVGDDNRGEEVKQRVGERVRDDPCQRLVAELHVVDLGLPCFAKLILVPICLFIVTVLSGKP